MELKTILTMVFICGLVLGGFLFFLTKAILFEKDKD